MTDLERRALLGDKQAQEECTRQGIALPCPQCYCKMKDQGEYFVHPKNWCGFSCDGSDTLLVVKKAALKKWNTRIAPPLGRCKDCANTTPGEDVLNHKDVIVCTVYGHRVEEDGLCREFEPKGEKDRDTHRD